MTLSSTYDHRIIQGAESGEFLRRVDQLLSGADGFYEAIFSSVWVAAPSALPKPAAVQPAGVTDTGAAEVARAAAAGMGLVMRYRTHGVNAAHLDPLSDASPFDPALEPASLGLDHAIMERVPATVLRVYAPGQTLADILTRLRETYCSTIAYEVEHISNHDQRSWLRQQIESGAHRKPLSRERKLKLLDRLTRVDSFERYLRKAFLGQKTFSIEGLDVMVPVLEETLGMLADEGTGEVRLGMAHRGRLAVITHVVDRPYEEVLLEFEQAQERGLVHREGDVTGDVKYHQGATGTYETENGKKIRVVLANNPSHLEAVDSVVEGQTRAVQTDRRENVATLDASRAAAILIHGDAAFTGQGVVAEVFNMQGLAGYTTGGTLHIIANNQIGFTTLPRDGRSTRYASDLAKGFDVPIIHVNADDIEAAVAAVYLAVEYRRRFHRDALIDLIGYRRFGHNEADEPAYTQPDMYERIATHPTAREIFARRLVEEGTLTEEEVNASAERAQRRVAEAHAAIKARAADGPAKEPKARPVDASNGAAVDTSVPVDVLRKLNVDLLKVPPGFTVHPKLARQLERRKDLEPKGEIDWGLGEALAFASLVREGIPIRVTGQDTERGTFSHRHLVLHDAKSGEPYAPMQHLSDATASFEIYNSPLSEYAAMGFEYGYSAEAPDALVLWEAQFGDFSNGGQIIIDQFIAAGRAKWQQTSRLTLLLPHAYEGDGPEH
jgi:2-oxoglutarate dehydrogenase E1 component